MITALRETSAQNTAIQTITFRVGTCTLDLVLVAATPQGICAILLGSDEKALVGQLRSIFPQAALQKDSKEPSGSIAYRNHQDHHAQDQSDFQDYRS